MKIQQEIAHDSVVGTTILEVIEAGLKGFEVHPDSYIGECLHKLLQGDAKITGLPSWRELRGTSVGKGKGENASERAIN